MAMVKDYLIEKYGERMVFQEACVFIQPGSQFTAGCNQAYNQGTKIGIPTSVSISSPGSRTGQIRA